jgi:hypothetical protein
VSGGEWGRLLFGDESDLAVVVRKVLGISAYEDVTVVSVHGRGTPLLIYVHPRTSAQLDKIKRLPYGVLCRMGVRLWSAEPMQGGLLYLYPAEWHDNIPEGYEVVDIDGRHRIWHRVQMSPDEWFGCLACGWIGPQLKTLETI